VRWARERTTEVRLHLTMKRSELFELIDTLAEMPRDRQPENASVTFNTATRVRVQHGKLPGYYTEIVGQS
jgi:hypothetical protein